MYYAKYIKYKNKYLNLKYQLGGTFDTVLIQKSKSNIIIPEELKTIEPIQKTRESLENNLVGIKVLYKQNIDKKLLLPLVEYNKKFKNRPIYFYRYTDRSNSSNSIYILCSLYDYWEILNKLQKKNVRIERITIDENGNVSLKLVNITIPELFNKDKIEDKDKKNILKNFKKDLVGVKILETNTELLKDLLTQLKDFKKRNTVYFYRYADKNCESYIICSLYDYYEFLAILYEHIEIEEVIIEKGKITPIMSSRIYHIIPKPQHVSLKEIILTPNLINSLEQLVNALKLNLFIIIRNNNLKLLPAICMYNLFIGTIHVFVIYQKAIQTNLFLLSLFTQYELDQKCIDKPPNVELKECRLYKQGDRIDIILNENFLGMMFNIFKGLRHTGFYSKRLYRGNPNIDNLYLNQLDTKILEKCRDCISIEDIAYNTTLYLLPDKIGAKDHKDILEMKKDFLKNRFELINSNEKLYLWRYKYEDLIQLWEYNFDELEKEIDKFKEQLLGLEPCHRELLVLKLNDKGYKGDTMEEILKNSALCYLNDKEDKEYKNKRLVYENSVQIDPIDPIDNEFVKKCKFIPEMKKLLNKRDSCEDIEFELHKYRQTVIMFLKNNENQIMYSNNQLYFFAFSWYDHKFNINYDKTFDPLEWSMKLNKIAFQCLALRDWLIFPLRIINIQYLDSPLSWALNIIRQEFCGFIYTRFNDNYNGVYNFTEECRDKFYFIYRYKDINIIDSSGKTYKPFYFTGNSIKFDTSILPYYKVILCEINWVYYTFILKNEEIPHFYEYINDYCEKEIVVSRFSLEEIRCKYEENSYNVSELAELTEVFYNHNYYKKENKTDTVFVDKSLFQSQEDKKKFIDDCFIKNKIIV